MQRLQVISLVMRNETVWEIQQGQIHGNTVADNWSGVVVQKPLGIQKCDQLSD